MLVVCGFLVLMSQFSKNFSVLLSGLFLVKSRDFAKNREEILTELGKFNDFE